MNTNITHVAIGGVNDEDEGIVVLVVVPPQLPQSVLSPHVPDGEGDVLVTDGLHVKPYGGNGVHVLAQLQAVQDGCLARCVQAEHSVSGDMEKRRGK